MNRKTVIKILICLAAVVLAWLAARFLFPVRDGVQAIRERDVLRVGTAGDYQPMSFLDPETGSYVGFDAALAEDLGEVESGQVSAAVQHPAAQNLPYGKDEERREERQRQCQQSAIVGFAQLVEEFDALWDFRCLEGHVYLLKWLIAIL